MRRDLATTVLSARARCPRAAHRVGPFALVLLGSLSCGPRWSSGAGSASGARFEGTARELDEGERASRLVSWRLRCPVAAADLRRLTVTHWGFDGQIRAGALIVHRDVAADVLVVFRSLFGARYPIEHLEPIEAYGGSDELSMSANNSSAFNCREVTGRPGTWSEHSFGRAIDLNPVQNPYVHEDTVLPEAGKRYLDRSSAEPAVIHANDGVVQAFRRIGWRWGGDWTSLKDYQHFSASGQ